MTAKEKAEEIRQEFIQKLTDNDKKSFNNILKNYICALYGKTTLYYDILLNLSTINLIGRDIPYERETKCFNCSSDLNEKSNFICQTCGWFICSCGACGCSEVKRVKRLKFPKFYTKDFSRKKSSDLSATIHSHKLPLDKNEFDSIFQGRAILQFQKSEKMLKQFNQMIQGNQTIEIIDIDDILHLA